MTAPGLSIAVIGSGPSGLYAVDGLLRKLPGVRVDVIDRLPTPYGLVRGGVAPDHQGTKAIVRQFGRTMGKEGVRFLGNVEVGRDVSVDELKGLYDAVVVALGAYEDRRLGIPGEDLPGVHGSWSFVGWYNGHPDFAGLNPDLSRPGAVVIGNGNVALDVCRILAKTGGELALSDIAPAALAAIQAGAQGDIFLAGRRGPVEAAFTPAELGELGHLSRARPVVDAVVLPEGVGDVDGREKPFKEKNLELLRGFAAGDGDQPRRIHMLFWAAPVAILGTDRVEGVRFERTRLEGGRAVGTGETFDVAAGLVVSAIGYRTAPLDGLPMDGGVVANADGRVAPGVYAVGWAKRGPSGTIPTNRADSLAVVDLMVADLEGAGGKPGGAALDALLAERGARVVSFADWEKIDAAEVAAATDPCPRVKFATVAEMLAATD